VAFWAVGSEVTSCALCKRQLASIDFTADSSFFDLQRPLQMNVPGEPESMVAIMKISIISEVVKTKLTAS